MDRHAFAVLMGVNKCADSAHFPELHCAEKDCQGLYQVLTDEQIGNFAKENVQLLLGSAVTIRQAEALLYKSVVNRAPEDIVLVYFSGHGFVTGSVSRMTRLSMAYIKIDRDILLHDSYDLTVRFVLDVAEHEILKLPKVVVEGVDDSHYIAPLYKAGVRYIQGFLTGEAGPELYALDKNLENHLSRLILGDTVESKRHYIVHSHERFGSARP